MPEDNIPEEPSFTPHQWAVLDILRKSQRPITANFIKKRIRMSWHTADKTLNELFKLGYVKYRETRGGTKYWKLI